MFSIGKAEIPGFLHKCRKAFSWHQAFNLVNVKLKWVKDSVLDTAVSGQNDLRAVCFLVSVISSSSRNSSSSLPVHSLTKHRGQLGFPHDLKLSTFVRRYPTVFHESSRLDSGGTRVPCFGLTPEAVELHQEEMNLVAGIRNDIVDRLTKLLMLTKERCLPLQTIDQLRWDLGLPYGYYESLILQHCSDKFYSVRLPDDRVGVKLREWDDRLAVSNLQKNAPLQQNEEDIESGCLSFPVGFTRGFGLKRKCSEWLEEWQKLPYTSPYADPSHLDVRTDVSEKRIVGVFHELLHLSLEKKTERKNVSNLRKALRLPQKFTRVFERHPGVFYISKKCDTQTVVLREGYERGQLLHKHPLVEIRDRYARLMRRGFLERSMGLHNKGELSIGEEHIQ
ncbi:Protein WHAT'S THIS FACTOR 9, mitochondrial [Linum perenne]